MKFISLFAGIGGLDLGLERAGMECVAQVEIDDFCQKVLTKHWANVPKFKDVRNVGKHNLPKADVICGGFPCQPHSYAGKRRGKADDRNLWGEYLRVIEELEPRFVIGENVPGLITTMLDEILSDLENLGYTCQTFIIPAGAFNAPHWRDRVWIIAYSNRDNDRGRRGQAGETNGIQGINWQTLCAREFGGTNQNATDSNSPAKPKEISERKTHIEKRTEIRGSIESGGGTNDANVTNATVTGLQGRANSGGFGEVRQDNNERITGCLAWNQPWFEVASALCRVDDGISRRLDKPRLKALGNAVVPQVAEFIGRCIMENIQ